MGVERIENGVAVARQFFAVMTPTRALGAVLLLTGSAVSVAIADAVLGTWGDEHLMWALAILSAVAVAALLLLFPFTLAFAKSTRLLARRMVLGYLKSRNESQFWQAVQADPRMLNEIRTMAVLQAGDRGVVRLEPRSATLRFIQGKWQAYAAKRSQDKADAYTLACAQQDPRLMADLQAAITRSRLS
jgi:uncharacterized protein YigA (DUF484 family)